MKKSIICFLLAFAMIFSSLPVSATENCTHEWSEWSVDEEPTCIDGSESRFCYLCDETQTRVLKATGEHDWSEWDVDEEPTCIDGSESRFCYSCDKTETRVLKATGEHDWDDWEVERAATISKEGIKERFCFQCDAIQTKKIAKLKPYAKISKKSLTLYTGSSYKLKVSYAKGDSVKKWTSSKSNVASVSSNGTVKAKRAGTTTITVSLKSGKKASCKVSVITRKKKKKHHKQHKAHASTVYWTPGGSVYHSTPNCPTLSRSRTIYHGSISSCPKGRACKVCF